MILFTQWTLPNFSWQLLGSDANPWDQWSCLPSKHTIIKNIHNHHHHLPNNWTKAKIFMTGCLCCRSIS